MINYGDFLIYLNLYDLANEYNCFEIELFNGDFDILFIKFIII